METMDSGLEIISNQYFGASIVLTTKHNKSTALAKSFKKILNADVIEYFADTDKLGTFTGEVERKGSPLVCVRKKCEIGIKGAKAEYGLASEGSFGPHPYIPFLPCNTEILYFIDKKQGFNLYISELSTATNYQIAEISSYEKLLEFAEKALFPSHALVIRPYPRNGTKPIFKGLQNCIDLEHAFNESFRLSRDKKIWVETDMRAHLNPTRMQAITKLGELLAKRLLSLCPECKTPGWGKVDIEIGLPCGWCGCATEEIKAEIHGCAKCRHKEKLPEKNARPKADPRHCSYCNP